MCASCLVTFAVWTAWLALLLLLCLPGLHRLGERAPDPAVPAARDRGPPRGVRGDREVRARDVRPVRAHPAAEGPLQAGVVQRAHRDGRRDLHPARPAGAPREALRGEGDPRHGGEPLHPRHALRLGPGREGHPGPGRGVLDHLEGRRVLGRLHELPPRGGVRLGARADQRGHRDPQRRAGHLPSAHRVRVEELRGPEPGVRPGGGADGRPRPRGRDGVPDAVGHAGGDRDRRALRGGPEHGRARGGRGPGDPRGVPVPAARQRAPDDLRRGHRREPAHRPEARPARPSRRDTRNPQGRDAGVQPEALRAHGRVRLVRGHALAAPLATDRPQRRARGPVEASAIALRPPRLGQRRASTWRQGPPTSPSRGSWLARRARPDLGPHPRQHPALCRPSRARRCLRQGPLPAGLEVRGRHRRASTPTTSSPTT